MPLCRFTCRADDSASFLAEMLRTRSQLDIRDNTSSADAERKEKSLSSSIDDKGEFSSSTPFELKYRNLPDHLKSCLDYCCTFAAIWYSIEKAKLVRLLLAEGRIQEKPGEIMEDTAERNVEELISLRILEELDDGTDLKVPYSYCRPSIKRQDFIATVSKDSLIRAVIYDDGSDFPADLPIHSLSVRIDEHRSCSGATRGLSQNSMKTVCGIKFLLVLDLYGKIAYLPDEVGDLIHLRYLGLVNSDLDKIPKSISKLQKLQTLDIRMCGKLYELPIEILNIQKLRHLLISKSIGDCEIRVPKGIGTLVNLHTFSGFYAGSGIARELTTLTQLRVLGVKRVSEDHVSELSDSIMKMTGLVSLSLEAESTFFEDTNLTLFPSLETFSPPPLLQELYLEGGLVEIPNWFASMNNLTSLCLSFSYLSDNPNTVLQYLPELKHLTLWEAYKAKHIGKEFCNTGGFLKLETLTISSDFLVEWTEIEDGAFPSLNFLSFRNCLKFRFLPEGLQNISTLRKLCLSPLHDDLARRLNHEEKYKIKHISVLQTSEPFRSTYSEIASILKLQ